MVHHKSYFRTLKQVFFNKQYLKWTLYRFEDRMNQFCFIQITFSIMISFDLVQIQFAQGHNSWIFGLALVLAHILICFSLTRLARIYQEVNKNTISQIKSLINYALQEVTLYWISKEHPLAAQRFGSFLSLFTVYSLPQFHFKIAVSLLGGIFSLQQTEQLTVLSLEYLLSLLCSCVIIETHQISEYMKYVGLFGIIERIPNALCIVDTDKKTLVYSNEQYMKLATTLSRETPDQDDEARLEQIQLNFLYNLSLQEVRNEGFQISQLLDQVDDEVITIDQYKIKYVQYSKDPIEVRGSIDLNPTKNDQFKTIKNELQSLNIFQDQVLKKAFITDINLHLELHHSPENFIQSSLRKNRQKRKISCQQSPVSQLRDVSIQYSKRQSMCVNLNKTETKSVEPQLPVFNQNASTAEKSGHGPNLVQHKMKFMVQLMENCQVLDENIQIYFINELSPFLLKTKVKKLEQVKKNLLRSISHELVTYLNGAYGYINQIQYHLQGKHIDRDQISKWVNLSLQYLLLQIHKIQDIFDFKDMLNGCLTLKPEVIGLKGVLQECIDLVREQTLQKKLSITLEVDPMLPSLIQVNCDRQRLTQVVLNLLSNAIRFTFAGSIKVKLEPVCSQRSLEEHFEETDLDDVVQISIVDTGLGMEHKQLQTLTKKLLASSDEKVSKESVGIGMGLLICKELLRLMGSKTMNSLFVRSTKGEGSTFYFFLQKIKQRCYERQLVSHKNFDSFKKPTSHKSLSSDIQRASNESVEIGSMRRLRPKFLIDEIVDPFTPIPCNCKRVLLVDDEQFNIDILRNFMSQIGYESDFAYNGKQALDRIDERIKNNTCLSPNCLIYNCILMDLNMPVMNGWHAAQKIRLSQVSNIPIIAVTAFGSPQDQMKCKQSGFDYVIVKPASVLTLRQAFQALKI